MVYPLTAPDWEFIAIVVVMLAAMVWIVAKGYEEEGR